MRASGIHIILLLFLWMLLSVIPSTAAAIDDGNKPPATYSFEFRGEQLRHVLETVARVTETDMIYDPSMIKDKNVYRRIQDKTMPELLSELLDGTSFDYIILSTGTIVIVHSVADEPAFGSLTGRVRDEQTGKPLHGATVFLADASGGAATNHNGVFHLNRMLNGTYRIIFSYVGYQPVEKIIEIRPDERTETEIELTPRFYTFTPVVVRAHRANLAGIDNRQLVHTLNEWSIYGGSYNTIRSLSLFSGLQYGLPMQDIHLQGGRQGEHRIRLDRIPVYNPHNFGHFYSAFSPLAIGEVELHKAGFGTQEGSMIAGIIDFRHDIPPDENTGARILADPLNINVRGDAGFSSGSGSSLAATGSIRTNFWNLIKEPVMNRTLREWDQVDHVLLSHLTLMQHAMSEYRPLTQTSDIRYFDSHVALQFEPNYYHTLQSSFYFGQNSISTSHLGERVTDNTTSNYLFTRDQYEWDNFIGQINWDFIPGPRTTVTTQIGFSSNRMNNHYRMETRDLPGFEQMSGVNPERTIYHSFDKELPPDLPTHSGDNRIRHGIFRTDITYSFSPGLDLETGLDLNSVSTSVDFSEFFYLPTSAVDHLFFGSMYANLVRRFGDYWQITGGTRFTRTDSHTGVFTEPRFSVQYDRSGSSIGYWSARLSGGFYRQFIHQYEITNIGPTSMVPAFTVWSHAMTQEVPQAYHISGSWINKPADHTSLKLEAYYKWEPTGFIASPQNLRTGYGIDRSTSAAFSESTRLTSLGASARFHRRFYDSRADLMLGYDYNRARLDMTSRFGRILPPPWSEPHRLQARAIIRLIEPLSVVLNWKSIYGRSWGFRQAYYDYLYLENVPGIGDFLFNRPQHDKLSPFHQLDLALLYRPVIGSVQFDIRADLINVLNRRNTIDWSLRSVITDDDLSPEMTSGETGNDVDSDTPQYEIRKRTMPGFYPVLRMEISF